MMNNVNAVIDDIRDIHPPIEVPIYVWILVGVILCAIIVSLYLYLKSRKVVVKPTVPIIIKTPWEIAQERLNLLIEKRYPENGAFKPFYSELSGIVRHYLEDRFKINAPEMTTEEFLVYVRSTAVLTMDQKRFLQEFLNGSDMVKFAKHEPNINEALENLRLAKELFLATKDGI